MQAAVPAYFDDSNKMNVCNQRAAENAGEDSPQRARRRAWLERASATSAPLR